MNTGSGFSWVLVNGSRQAKTDPKERRKNTNIFRVLKSWMFSLKCWRLVLDLGNTSCLSRIAILLFRTEEIEGFFIVVDQDPHGSAFI